MTTRFFRNQLKIALINGAIALGIAISAISYNYVKTYYAFKEQQREIEELKSNQGNYNSTEW